MRNKKETFIKVVLVLIAILALGGLLKLAVKNQEKGFLTQPTKEEFQYSHIYVYDTRIGDLYLYDIDKDGIVDIICSAENYHSSWVIYYAPEVPEEKLNRFGMRGFSRHMTPEIRTAASAYLKAFSELDFELTNEVHVKLKEVKALQ